MKIEFFTWICDTCPDNGNISCTVYTDDKHRAPSGCPFGKKIVLWEPDGSNFYEKEVTK